MQAGVVLKANVPIEVHASKVYTRTIFEQFGLALYESGQYLLDELEPGKLYLARHTRAVAKEKWCKVVFHVRVDRSSEEFDCECGYFEHAGMLCCHTLKVMVHLGYESIPDRYVLKRWTKDARDILPPNLVRYQKDRGVPNCSSYRHSSLQLTCLEVNALGDANMQCYEKAMRVMLKLKNDLLPMSKVKDGLGVEVREKELHQVKMDAPASDEHEVRGVIVS
ncbi:hypothetical protein BRADI_4g44732v3 [Brachypodium distachyon]|uniref:SWIM-type domain-containing protein n=1 Tax=Brachypodium distachyon TaxID=15368 RepID=A0A2K2CU86_BRADI|nr:hypothetical protein BRADI_4g44732v3 [Brachypodium distachyon]